MTLAVLISSPGAFALSKACDPAKQADLPRTLERFVVHNFDQDCLSLETLGSNLQRGLEQFEAVFGKVEGPLVINIGQGIQTGYNMTSGEINFSKSNKIAQLGLESADVITHELFHQLTCRKYPDFCRQLQTDDDNLDLQALAEGLADYFAYSLKNDSCFGENFYLASSCVRRYHTDLDYSLIDGGHQKGNVISSYLIDEKIPLAAIKTFFESQQYTLASLIPVRSHSRFGIDALKPDISIRASGLIPKFRGQAFKLDGAADGKLEIEPNEALRSRYPNAIVKFVRASSEGPDSIRDLGRNQFLIDHTAIGTTKYLLRIESDDKIVGERRVFIQVRDSKLVTR